MVTPSKILPLLPPKAPNLPIGPVNYAQDYINQLLNVLRLYFNQLDNMGSILAGQGGAFLNNPYGAFSSFVDQTTTANTATLMTLDTTDFSNGVSISSSQITPDVAGIYNLQFSAQFQNTDNAIQDISIWLKQYTAATATLADIPGSTGLVSIPARKSASAGEEAHQITGWNYYVSLAVGDYIQIYWSTTLASVTIQTYPTSVSPTRPSTASVVATLTFVSAL